METLLYLQLFYKHKIISKKFLKAHSSGNSDSVLSHLPRETIKSAHLL